MQIGPCYDACWLTAFTDQLWPGPPKVNPLLPWRLQAEYEMPAATSALAYKQAVATLTRIRAQVPDLTLSYALQDGDVINGPSCLLAALPVAPEGRAGLGVRPSAHPWQAGSQPWETVADPAPAFAGNRIPGGTRTLDQQVVCPLRAFIEARLGAREFVAPERALGPRQRGIAVHDALEQLYRPALKSGKPVDFTELRTRLPAVIERVLLETIPWSCGAWPAIRAIEQMTIERMLQAFLELDSRRPVFSIVDLERQHEFDLAGVKIKGRIDRIDAADDGSWIVIDYKTGRSVTPAGWFHRPPSAVQMPLYSLLAGAPVTALLLADLAAEPAAFRGAGAVPADFPLRSSRIPENRSWPEQIECWRAQLSDLAIAFCAGDLRVLLNATEAVEGSFATLSRIYDADRATLSLDADR
jgi:RecB family exonuclease